MVSELNNKLTEVPFVCTPSGGITIEISNCYTVGKTAYINLKLIKSDGSLFTAGEQTLCLIPQNPISLVESFNCIGLTSGGIAREVKIGFLMAWNKTIHATTVGTDTKEIYVSLSYKFA